jgi:AcrR family transcriptional regulator
MSRPYTLKQRAAQMEDTRRRIAEAAMALHGSLGPARTTISAIAGQAGVERATVYRHFADEAAIFAACSALWMAQHPPPDPSAWRDPDVLGRLREGLGDMYRYYESTRRMWQLVYQDAPHAEALADPFRQWLGFLEMVTDVLAAPSGAARGRRRLRVRAAIRHAVDFRTWDGMTASGLDAGAIVELMEAMVAAA